MVALPLLSYSSLGKAYPSPNDPNWIKSIKVFPLCEYLRLTLSKVISLSIKFLVSFW